jgi:hypothetical protein
MDNGARNAGHVRCKPDLQPDDITVAFERYRKLSQQTARNIVTMSGA